MTDIAELMRANLLEVFGEPDADRRRAAVERVYAEDVVFADPDAVVTGREALHAKAQEILDGAPGFVFAPDGDVRVNHDLAQLAWTLGPEGQAPVVRGSDVALIADGRIARVWTFLG